MVLANFDTVRMKRRMVKMNIILTIIILLLVIFGVFVRAKSWTKWIEHFSSKEENGDDENNSL